MEMEMNQDKEMNNTSPAEYYEVMNLTMSEFKRRNMGYIKSMWIQGKNADWRREIWK